MKPLRVALFYNHEPTGHSQAAAAIAEELSARDASIETLRVNLSGDLHPVLGPVIAQTYLSIATSLPSLWDYLYDNAAVADAAEGLLSMLRKREGERIRTFLREARPDVVVATQALPCNVVAFEKRAGRVRVPLIGVLTDYVAHRYWIARGVDRYCAPTEETRDALHRQGIASERVRVTGIPIARAFAQPPSREAARRALKLDPARPVLLVTGGTKGLGGIEDAVAAIAGGPAHPQILASCGTNAPLYSRLRRKALPDVRVSRGLESKMPEMLAASDLLVGKAGGLTTAEALAMGLPLAIYSTLPGQERHNARYLERHGAAVGAETPQELAAAVRELLAGPARLAKLAAAARALGRPDSARQVADVVLEVVAAHSGLILSTTTLHPGVNVSSRVENR